MCRPQVRKYQVQDVNCLLLIRISILFPDSFRFVKVGENLNAFVYFLNTLRLPKI